MPGRRKQTIGRDERNVMAEDLESKLAECSGLADNIAISLTDAACAEPGPGDIGSNNADEWQKVRRELDAIIKRIGRLAR